MVFKNWSNHHNLPDWVTSAFEPWYKPLEDEIRVTQLIAGPRQRTLQITHWDEIQRDYSDMLMASEGTAIHAFYEDRGPLSEHRQRDSVYGLKVTGKPDGYKDGIVWDIKNKFIGWDKYSNSFDSLERQLNSYAWLLRRKGYEVKKLEAWARLRDWKPMSAFREKKYPQCQWQGPYDITLWDYDEQDSFICDRIKDHLENPMRMCTPEERMKQETQYKIWNKPKDGNNKATVASVPFTGGREKITTWSQAKQIAEQKGLVNKDGSLKKDVWIEKLSGEDLMCKYFCSVRSVCEHGKKFCVI